MRAFFYRLASRLKAPLRLRAWLMPEGGRAIAVGEVSDPVSLFYRELGLDKEGSERKYTGWLMRVIRSTRAWPGSDMAGSASTALANLTLFIFSGVAMLVSNFHSVFAFVVASVLVFVNAIVVAFFAFLINQNNGLRKNTVVFLMSFAEVLVLYVASFFLTIPLAWVPITFLVMMWLWQGIKGAKNETQPGMRKARNTEQLVSEAFDRFVAINHPDIVDEKSALNTKLTALADRISRANNLLAKLQGELEADKRRQGGRAEVIEQSIDQITLRLGQLRSEESALRASKAELVSAFQMFSSLKDDAVSYVRLQDLSKEADDVLGEASALARQAGIELENIRGRIRDGLERINLAVENLGLSTLALDDGGSMKALTAGAERIGEQTVARQQEFVRLIV